MDNPVDNLDWGDSAAARQEPVPTMPVLHLEGFDGPMDLLLDLAERQLIDLGKMSILALAEQFAAVMERMDGSCRARAARRLAGAGDSAGGAADPAAVSGKRGRSGGCCPRSGC